MRTYINILLMAVMSGIVLSCSPDDSMLAGVDSANVKLTLQLGAQVNPATRAEVAANCSIDKVDIFFYNKDATDKDYVYSVKGHTEIGGDGQIKNINIPIDKYYMLFPGNEEHCLVYVVVNRRQGDEMPEDDPSSDTDMSLAMLKKKITLAASEFKGSVEVSGDTKTYTQFSPDENFRFVMDGSAEVRREGSTLAGTIEVKRVAVKLSLVIDEIQPLDDAGNSYDPDKGGPVWVPDYNNLKITLRRGSAKTNLDYTNSEEIFDIENISLKKIGVSGNSYSTELPFYTYPTNWSNNDNLRTHFILIVKWDKKSSIDSEDVIEYNITYYEVNVNLAQPYTEQNCHYKITQTIGIFGSPEEETAVTLNSTCSILPWGFTVSGANSTVSNAVINTFNFLVVDETNVVMDNVESKRISFFSSAPINIQSAEIKWEYTAKDVSELLTFADLSNAEKTLNASGDTVYIFSNDERVTVDNRIVGSDSDPEHDYRVKITIHNADPNVSTDQSYINVEHKLDNEMKTTSDFSQYIINFKVQHANNEDYNERINITQYPMISVVANINSDYVNDGKVDGNDNNYYGHVWINGAQNYLSGTGWAQIGGLPTNAAINQNPNIYLVSVAALADTDISRNYIIGDPRESTPRVPDGIYSANGNTLTYYYPTNPSIDTRFIAPQFLVASSYGYCPQPIDNLEDAERRCATYQEDGYQAGRWRVPTKAEVQYIIQLSEWGVIPKLFSTNTWYWSAHGAVQYTGSGFNVSSESGRVRCVYDAWYWGTEKLADSAKTKFTYGDKQR